MFLSKLNNEQKELFLQLCIHAALANDIFEDEQRALVHEYCAEMGINDYKLEINIDLDTLLNKIKECCGQAEINIFMFEVLAIIKSDNVYDDYEKQFTSVMMDKFEFDDNTLKEMADIIDELMCMYKKITTILFADV